jgi:hypothetical protein
MIDKYQILLESLYYETVVNKDFEKYKELVWETEGLKTAVEYYKDDIYKQITYFKDDSRVIDPLIRYFNGWNKELQQLNLHRLDGPAYIQENTKNYYIDGKPISYIEFLALTKVEPENRENMKDLLDV